MCETWHTNEIQPKFSMNHRTIDIKAVKTATKGRASGGLLITYDVKKYSNVETIAEHNNYIFIKLSICGQIYIIGNVYINQATDTQVIFNELEELLQIYSELYKEASIIVGGDYNARIADKGTCDENQLPVKGLFANKRESLDSVFNSRGRDLIDFCEKNELFIINGRFPGDWPSQFTYVGAQGTSVIDIAVCNVKALYKIKDFNVSQQLTKSDHLPISIVLDIYEKSIFDKKEKLKWKENSCNNFVNKMQYLSNVASINLDLNDMALNLVNSIKSVAKEVNMCIKVGSNKIKKKSQIWYDDSCKEYREFLDKEFKKVKELKFPRELVADLHLIRNNYYKFINEKKESFLYNKVTLLCNSRESKVFWENINSFRLVEKTETNCIDLPTWSQFFKNVYSPKPNRRDLVLQTNTICPALDGEITLDELNLALKKCKSGKAPGADEISNDFLKNLPNNWILYILLLFNKILKEEKVPIFWGDIITKMLYKKGDMLNPENYRPISLVNTIVKLFTIILFSRIAKWAESNGKLPEWQAGFRSKRSTTDHIFVLNCIVQMQLRKKGGKLYGLFVDLKRAFDSVSHDLLWKKLSNLGMSSKIIKIIASLYINANMAVKTPEGLSENCKINQGLLQGETLSPILFALFIADIEQFLIGRGVRGVSLNHLVEAILLAFADDMVFLSDSYIQLKSIVKHLQDYFTLNELDLNVQKTNIVLFQKGGHGHKKKLSPVLYKGKEIEFVKSYVYLGVPFTQSGTYEMASKHFISKGKNAIQPTVNIINKMQITNSNVINKLFKALVISTALYAAPVWSARHMNDLGIVQNSYYKKLLCMPLNTPGYSIRVEMSVERIELIIFKNVLNYVQKILKMDENRYPRICFNRIRALAQYDSSKGKYNWANQIKTHFFETIGRSDFWENITAESIKLERENLVEALRQNLYKNDVDSCKISTSLTILPALIHVGSIIKYLDLKVPLKFKKIIAQLRMHNQYCPRIIINKEKHITNSQSYCEYCIDQDSLFHSLIYCKYFENERTIYLNEIALSVDQKSQVFCNYLNNLNESKIRKLVKFICIILSKK